MSDIEESYEDGYRDGYDEGEADGIELASDHIYHEVSLLQPDDLIDSEEGRDWIDGYQTAKKLCLNIIKDGV